MYIFNGIDLNSKYVKPATWRWIKDCAYDFDAPMLCYVYDGGQGAVIWTYASDPEYPGFPEELRTIINTAMEREWRFIVIDCDGADCELFEDYSEEWDD